MFKKRNGKEIYKYINSIFPGVGIVDTFNFPIFIFLDLASFQQFNM